MGMDKKRWAYIKKLSTLEIGHPINIPTDKVVSGNALEDRGTRRNRSRKDKTLVSWRERSRRYMQVDPKNPYKGVRQVVV